MHYFSIFQKIKQTMRNIKYIQMNKIKVYQKNYQLPELPETLWTLTFRAFGRKPQLVGKF